MDWSAWIPKCWERLFPWDTVHIWSMVITPSYYLLLLSGPVEFYCIWLPCHVQTFCTDSSWIKLNIISSITSLLGGSQLLSSSLKLFVESCLFDITSSCLLWLCIISDMLFSSIFYKLLEICLNKKNIISTSTGTNHLPGYAGNCKLFALVARDLEAHFTFGTRKRRLSTSQQVAGGRGWGQMMAFFCRLFSSQFDLFANFWLENHGKLI